MDYQITDKGLDRIADLLVDGGYLDDIEGLAEAKDDEFKYGLLVYRAAQKWLEDYRKAESHTTDKTANAVLLAMFIQQIEPFVLSVN